MKLAFTKCGKFQWTALSILVYAANLLSVLQPACSSNPSDILLLRTLFDSSTYDKRARPTPPDNGTVAIEIQYWLLSIVDLDERQQMITMMGYLEMEWVDPALSWNVDDYGGQKYLVVPADDVWTPDIIIRNSADSVYGSNFLDPKLYRLIIQSDGTVVYKVAGLTNTRCSLNLRFFPFDRQVCYIEYNSWSFDNSQIVNINKSSKPEMSRYKQNDQWDVEKSEVYAYTENMDGYLYNNILFIFYLRRKPLFFVTTLIFPCVVLSSLSLLVFLLPPETDEKITLSITILLSYTVFQLLVVNTMPETSNYVPIIVIYLTCAMIMSGMSLLCAIIVLRFEHHPATKRPPDWLRRFLLHYVATTLRMHHNKVAPLSVKQAKDNLSQKNNDNAKSVSAAADSTAAAAVTRISLINLSTSSLRHQDMEMTSSATDDQKHYPSRSLTGRRRINHNSNISGREADVTQGYELEDLEMMSFKEREEFEELAKLGPQQRAAKAEWRELSRVMDVFYFLIFLVATVVVSLALLVWYPMATPSEVELVTVM